MLRQVAAWQQIPSVSPTAAIRTCAHVMGVCDSYIGTRPIPLIHLLFAFPLFIFFFKLEKTHTHRQITTSTESLRGIYFSDDEHIGGSKQKHVGERKEFFPVYIRIILYIHYSFFYS